MSKRNIVILAVVALLVIVGIVFMFSGKYSSPQRTYNTMIKSIEKGDIDSYLDCLTENSRKIMVDSGIKEKDGEDFKKAVENFKKPDFKLSEKEGDTAVMTSEEDENAILVFKKENRKWKLDLEETFKMMFEKSFK